MLLQNQSMRRMEAPEFPDFTLQEFEERYARARRMMMQKNVDMLLISERLNYQYFSGHRSMQKPIDKLRPYVFLLPKDREPIIIAPKFEFGQLEQTTYFSSNQIYAVNDLFGHAETITKIIKSLGYQNAVIGTEFGREQYIGLSYSIYSDIMKGLPGAQFVDASDILLKIRAIKSPVEIAYTKKACQITAQALKDTLPQIHAGMSEEDIAKWIRVRLFELGAETITFMYVVSGTDKDAIGINPVPTKRIIQNGETFCVDIGVSYKGYCSDVARTASVGYASDELKEFYLWLNELRHQCEMKLKPGIKPAEIMELCRSSMEKRGIVKADVGRIGHGIGLDSTEYPSIATFEDLTLEPGMIIACNPNFINEFGFINIEDNLLITEDSVERLSTPEAEDEIPIVG
jgi:Xaa-Pro aminopeptidase